MQVPRESTRKMLQAGYRQLFERYPLPMLVVDLTTLRLMAANDAAAQCYGYTEQQLTELHLPDIYFEEDQRSLPAYMALDPQQRAHQRRWRHRGEGGRAIDVEIDTEDMQLHGLSTRMLLVSDVTPARPRQTACGKPLDEANRLMLQEKKLLKRVAQALHDQLGQTTAAIRITHETMGLLRCGGESHDYLQLDQQLGRLIDQATRQVRTVLADLHPPLLDENGLAAALDNELHGRALNPGAMQFVLKVPPDVQDLRWPATVEYAAFMVAREAIENAVRHARASVVTVSLAGSTDRVELDIVDNGQGAAAKPQSRAGHLGITGMLERASAIGGTVSVGPAQPAGTRVRLLWKSAP